MVIEPSCIFGMVPEKEAIHNQLQEHARNTKFGARKEQVIRWQPVEELPGYVKTLKEIQETKHASI